MAKINKDYSEADHFKSALEDAGVDVKITPDGPKLSEGAGFDASKLEGLK